MVGLVEQNQSSLFDKITSLVNKGDCVGIEYLDFSKPFDLVSHVILILKNLHCIELKGHMLGRLNIGSPTEYRI